MKDHTPTLHPSNDVIPAFATAVRALFDSALGDVTFPGVDATVLDAASDVLRDAQRALDDAKRIVDEREQTVAEARDALMLLADRGAAYCRIFADGENDDDLRAQLDDLPSRRSAEAPRTEARQIRRRKSKPSNPDASRELLLTVESAAA